MIQMTDSKKIKKELQPEDIVTEFSSSEQKTDADIFTDLKKTPFLRKAYLFAWQRIVQEKLPHFFSSDLKCALKISTAYAYVLLQRMTEEHSVLESELISGNMRRYVLKKDEKGEFVIRKYIIFANELVQREKGEKNGNNRRKQEKNK